MASIRIHEDVNDNVVAGVKRKCEEMEIDKNMKKRAAFSCIGGKELQVKRIIQSTCNNTQKLCSNFLEIPSTSGLKGDKKPIEDVVEDVIEEDVIEEDVIEEDNMDCMEEDLSILEGKNFSDLQIKMEEDEDLCEEFLHQDEYRMCTFMYLMELELRYSWPNPMCIKRQRHFQSEHRSIMVDWLVSVGNEHKMSDQTVHLTINYIDRFISKMLVRLDKLQLVGAASMWIAAKTEEVYPPDAAEFVYLCGDAYTTDQLTRMEKQILSVLKFDIQPPTMSAFIDHICNKHKLDKETMCLSKYLSELVLVNGVNFFEYLPSKLAAACVALARLTLSKYKPWPKQLASFSGCTLQQLSPIIKKQQKVFEHSSKNENSSVRKKYLSSKYEKVGALKPKNLMLDFED